jgi:hypothetical protein
MVRAPVTALRALYVDLDGTLLGRGGSFLHDGDGRFTTIGARALEACARADVEVVFYSGRRRTQLAETARLLGVRSYVFELGAGVVADGDVLPLAGDWTHQRIAASGAVQLLLDRLPLEPHDPWHTGREVTHLLRGAADSAEADALLEAAGHGDLQLVDNGPVHRTVAGRPARAFHLLPRGVSKAAGVAAHQRVRGLRPDECVAVGDSPADTEVAAVVGAFWLVANAPADARGRRAEAAHGAGVYEAVMTELAERR